MYLLELQQNEYLLWAGGMLRHEDATASAGALREAESPGELLTRWG